MRPRYRAIAAALALISILAMSACGGSKVGHFPETVATARKAIEDLRYDIDVHEAPGQEGALIAELHGKLGETERFYVFVHGYAPLRIPEVVRALGAGNANQIEGGELHGPLRALLAHRAPPRRESQTEGGELSGDLCGGRCPLRAGDRRNLRDLAAAGATGLDVAFTSRGTDHVWQSAPPRHPRARVDAYSCIDEGRRRSWARTSARYAWPPLHAGHSDSDSAPGTGNGGAGRHTSRAAPCRGSRTPGRRQG